MREKHLPAGLDRLEKSLLKRAAKLHERGSAMTPGPEANILLAMAAEFTELAGELHEL